MKADLPISCQNRLRLFLTVILLLFANPFVTFGESGGWFSTHYGPRVYNAHPQNFAVVQDDSGIMFFGNTEGVLEFDGKIWNLIPTEKGSSVRSLALHKDGTVYVGGQGEFGYLGLQDNGARTFISLSHLVKENEKDFGDVWKTFATGDAVWFVTNQAVFLYRNNAVEMIPIPGRLLPDYAFSTGKQQYLISRSNGLVTLDGRALVPVPGSELLPGQRIYGLVELGPDNLLLLTRENGLLQLKNRTITPFNQEANTYLTQRLVSGLTRLTNGDLVVSTLDNGFLICDATGNPKSSVNVSSGLPDNMVFQTFQDREGGLWATLNKGIARLEYESPFSVFDESFGLDGMITALCRHNGKLFAATQLGLFVLESGNKSNGFTPKFQPVQGFLTECTGLYSSGDQLFVATTGGLFILTGSQNLVQQIFPQPVFSLAADGAGKLLLGLSDGIASADFSGGQPQIQSFSFETGGPVVSLGREKGGAIWVSGDNGRIQRIVLSGSEAKVTGEGAELGIPFSRINHVVIIQGTAWAATRSGLLQWNESNQKFEPNEKITRQLNIFSQPIRFLKQGEGDIFWIQTTEKSGAVQVSSAGFQWAFPAFSRLPADFVITDVFQEKDGICWIAGQDGLLRFNSKYRKSQDFKFATFLRSVSFGSDSVLHDKLVSLLGGTPGSRYQVNYFDNSVRFEFGAPGFDNSEAIRYRIRLDGFEKQWSEPSKETIKEYTNLPPGDYTFRVLAINGYDRESSEANFVFTVLPPWYQTLWVQILFVALIVLLFLLIVRWRSHQLKKENLKLEQIVEERTRELKETQEQLISQEKLASLGQLTAGIAHEIQNPLNFVNNFSELSREMAEEIREELLKVEDKIPAETLEEVNAILEELDTNLEKINHHGKRADSIVKNMLQHSRSKVGVKGPVELNNMISEYLQMAFHGYRAKDHTFQAKLTTLLDPNVGIIQAIGQDLSRVIINIIHNGLYAVHKKKLTVGGNFEPELIISTTRKNGKVEIRIRDNGSGIPESEKNKIFNPFFTTKPTGEGTGLGLSISYEIIVKQHKGKIDFQSKEGEFTEFFIELPTD